MKKISYKKDVIYLKYMGVVCVCVFVYICYILDDKMAPCYFPPDLYPKAGYPC